MKWTDAERSIQEIRKTERERERKDESHTTNICKSPPYRITICNTHVMMMMILPRVDAHTYSEADDPNFGILESIVHQMKGSSARYVLCPFAHVRPHMQYR